MFIRILVWVVYWCVHLCACSQRKSATKTLHCHILWYWQQHNDVESMVFISHVQSRNTFLNILPLSVTHPLVFSFRDVTNSKVDVCKYKCNFMSNQSSVKKIKTHGWNQKTKPTWCRHVWIKELKLLKQTENMTWCVMQSLNVLFKPVHYSKVVITHSGFGSCFFFFF